MSEDLIDTAYGMLATFFGLDRDATEQLTVPGAHRRTGYTSLLVEPATAADALAEVLDEVNLIEAARRV